MLNAFKNKRFRNRATIGIVILGVLFLAGKTFLSAQADVATVEPAGKVVSVVAAQTVETSGALQAQPFASLTWKTSGVVEDVYVKAGDQVEAGDVLMKLNMTSVPSGVFSAQANLLNAQKELETLLISSDEDLAQAVIDLKDTKEAYDQSASYLKYLQTSQKVPQAETKIFIEENFGKWRYRYKSRDFKGPAPQDWITEAENDLALKKAQLEDAQRAYDRLKDGANTQDVAAAQARIDAAQAAVESMSILAPFDGQVLYVASQPNDVVTVDSAALNMADLAHLYVEAQVSESDIVNLNVGNPVKATLQTAPGLELTGHVAAINALGKADSGTVQYTVRIDIGPVKEAAVSLPLGSTANLTIQVKEAAQSLAVPITVIQNDTQGEYVLAIQADGSTKRVDVVTGAIVGDLVTVTGDLREGDSLAISPVDNSIPRPGSGRGLGRMLR